MDAKEEPVLESVPIGGDMSTTDFDNDNDDNESYNSEIGSEDRESLDDVESDNSSDGGNIYDQDLDYYDD